MPSERALTRRLVFAIFAFFIFAGSTGRTFQERTFADILAEGFRAVDSRQFDRALQEFAEALRLAEANGVPLEIGRALQGRGLAFFYKADWPHMEEAYTAAAATFASAGAFREQADTLRSLTFSGRLSWEDREQLVERGLAALSRAPDPATEGRLLHQLGDILFNQGRYGRSLEKLRQALPLLRAPNDRASLARLLTSVGRSYRFHGLADDAIKQYRQALGTQIALSDLGGAAQSENAIAVALAGSGRQRAALPHSVRALALAERAGEPRQVAFLRMNLADSYVKLGDPRPALPLLAPGPVGFHPEEPVRLLMLARAHLRLNQRSAALAEAEEAVAAARVVGDPEKVAHSLGVRAQSHLALGHVEAAYRDNAEALEVVEQMRANLAPEDRFRQNFSDTIGTLFTSAIHVLTRLGRHAEALDVAERARARAFLDLLASRDVAVASASDAREAERRRLIAAEPISHEAMRASLAGLHSTLVSYWIAPDEAHVWVMGPDGAVHGRRLTLTATRLRSLIDALAAGSAQPRQDQADPARVLYDQLIAPIASWLPTRAGSLLTIVPHGPLFRLPFAALRDSKGSYLVERHALHYVTSLSVLGQTSARLPHTGDRGALLVADPAVDRTRDGLPRLSGARAEVAAIARGLAPRTVSVLTGAAATEAAVKRAAPSSRILHFATHAVVSDAGPLDSFLALTSGAGEDGRVTSAEIYEWKLDADLVVLSACRTARGRISGDGVIGLSRAFAYAGAPSLMATVWDAPDETASVLLPAFYAAWRRSGNRAGALRSAQLELIRRLRAGEIVVRTPAGSVTLHERPSLWAPFVLLGAP